jgi:hypothetical protein
MIFCKNHLFFKNFIFHKKIAMYAIKLNVEKEYLITFLSYLETLQAVQIEKITKKQENQVLVSPQAPNFAADNVRKRALKPIRKGITLQQILKEQNYKGTDWSKVDEIAMALNLQEPLNDLLNQLTP